VTPLGEAQRASLAALLRVLDLQDTGDDAFRADGGPGQFPHTFGGQLVAQAVAAATATGDGAPPSSVHAAFVAAGVPAEPVDLTVRRVRDGRSLATRAVDIHQAGRSLLAALVSLHAGVPAVAPPPGALTGPGPDELPTLQDWVPGAPRPMRDHTRSWIDRPPPIEIRIGEPPVFLGGPQRPGPRAHWMRLRDPVGDDPALHAALLAHASDYLLLDMAFRSHPVPFATGRLGGTSLDHSVWFHRPVRLDGWHRYTQETVALAGERGLVRGAIHDEAGHLVASTAQEVLVRVADVATR
jgi:acyl-CoA thioesterase II